jgi:hypothetical protein
VVCDRDAESNRNGAPKEPPLSPDNRAAPARDDRSARIRTRTSEVGARRASGYTTDLDSSVSWRVAACPYAGGTVLATRPAGRRVRSVARRPAEPGYAGRERAAGQGSESGRPGSNGPLRGGAPVLFRLSYVRLCARLESNQRACRIRAVLSTELRAFEEPPAGVEPAPRPYKGRVLPLTLRRQEVETAGVEPTPPRCKRGVLPPERPPDRCGRMESNHHSLRLRGYSPVSSPVLSVRLIFGGTWLD